MSGMEDAQGDSRRKYKSPYTAQHPIPTVRQYREERERRKTNVDDVDEKKSEHPERYGAENKNISAQSSNEALVQNQIDANTKQDSESDENDSSESKPNQTPEDTSQAISTENDAKAKRKNLKKRKEDGKGREVTDPVTHLPVTIHDFTNEDLKNANEDEPELIGDLRHIASDLSTSGKKSEKELENNANYGQDAHRGMERLFPPPEFDDTRKQITAIHGKIFTTGILATLFIYGSSILAEHFATILLDDDSKDRSRQAMIGQYGIRATAALLVLLIVFIIRAWNGKAMKEVWESSVWESERQQGKEIVKSQTPESTHWLNALLASVWPLINPDLFISVSDTLEDVMQASLPKLVRMISVEDIGQGSEALRILGVRWLPKGAATHSVTADGKLKRTKTDPQKSDRTVPGQGSVQPSTEEDSNDESDDEPKAKRKQDEQEHENVEEGMEAEEGDFVNMEIAFAYKARLSYHGLRSRSKNPHLYLGFYMPGNIRLPVWVELRGLIGTMRVRLQLTPDPPFFSLCTLTFLGQPKVDLSCVPLVKRGLNIMDLPLISNFVQSAVDAAMAEYVAPKSLTLDLKDMLVGDDFKKDTMGRGVLVVHIKRAYDFKEGDAGFGPIKKGSTDGYVTVGWAKFGKPVWSTRVIEADMTPHWDETAYVIVSPDELNVQERLRVQLWDSDRATADDDLGRIEVDLRDIMKSSQSNGKMWDRQDGFRSLKAGESMPGKLEWSVGYFSKTRILDEQLAEQSQEPDIKTVKDLRKKVGEESERKLRESKKDETSEIKQQKAQDFKARQDQLMISSPPPADYPSGILSIVIHQISGLELEAINKTQMNKQETQSDEQEEGDDMPSSYCTIILNHQKIYKTRTKPKNSKPFFNAGCERFISDINSAQIHIAIRDARVHEDDALIGIVYFPLAEIFAKRSQVNGFWPLAGGIGYGKIRISMVFRAVQLQVPLERLGWEYGTLDVAPKIKGEVSEELRNCKLRIRTNLGSGKFHSAESGSWTGKRGKPIRLAVKKRYSSCLVVEFRSGSTLSDSTPAFAVLWLKDIPDDDEKTIKLSVWKGDLAKAQTNVLEEYGENVGYIELNLAFWHGLSGYHLPLAKKDHNVEDVMEVLDCANDVDDNEQLDEDGSSSSDSDSDSDSDGEIQEPKDVPHRKSKFLENSDDLEGDGSRGIFSQVEDYKKHRKQLHRRNRGLMQWKAPRTLQWMQKKLDHGQQNVVGLFRHHERDSGIETEV